MIRKMTPVLLAAVAAVSLSACSAGDSTPDDSHDATAAPVTSWDDVVAGLVSAPAPVETPVPVEVISEDDPRFDCRTMGNLMCGVEVHGVTYLLHFEDGAPSYFEPAP